MGMIRGASRTVDARRGSSPVRSLMIQRKCAACGSSPAGYDEKCETCRSPEPRLQRKPIGDETATTAVQGLIVDDGAGTLTGGQMRKSQFLDEIGRAHV